MIDKAMRDFIISEALIDYYWKVSASLRHRRYAFSLKDIEKLIVEHKGKLKL